jgi:hypothetical protein
MTQHESLPPKVADMILHTSFAEFATLNAEGTPIDTPLLNFPDDDLSKINMATGVSYPIKADRARRNPKVGLLYTPLHPDEPVVQVIGLAAVRDSDIQDNLIRYITETVHVAPETPWELKRQAIWYWARIIIEIHPKQVVWWDSAADLDKAPHRWDAPAGTVFPPSDPAPAGTPAPANKWPQPDWREAARIDVGAGYPGYVSLVDEEGFPRIMPARDVQVTDTGLSFDLPAGAPGRRSGPACLTYFGRDTFLGQASEAGGRVRLDVARTLPILPMVGGGDSLWEPSADLKEKLMGRLTAELARRGQKMPSAPDKPPVQGASARRRAERDTKGADARMFERQSKT